MSLIDDIERLKKQITESTDGLSLELQKRRDQVKGMSYVLQLKAELDGDTSIEPMRQSELVRLLHHPFALVRMLATEVAERRGIQLISEGEPS